jgi:hypothetical protein
MDKLRPDENNGFYHDRRLPRAWKVRRSEDEADTVIVRLGEGWTHHIAHVPFWVFLSFILPISIFRSIFISFTAATRPSEIMPAVAVTAVIGVSALASIVTYANLQSFFAKTRWVIGPNILSVRESFLKSKEVSYSNAHLRLTRTETTDQRCPIRCKVVIVDRAFDFTLFSQQYPRDQRFDHSRYPQEILDLCSFLQEHTEWTCLIDNGEDDSVSVNAPYLTEKQT